MILFDLIWLYNSAHGVPVSYIKSGDPYKSHIENCTKLISEHLQTILDSQSSNSNSNQPIEVILTGLFDLLIFFYLFFYVICF